MKECNKCSRQFIPSSRHLSCPACRFKNKPRKGTTPNFAGYLNPRWRGGKTIHKKGYVMVRCEGKYVMEHILVMEEALGRKLKDRENVHHINGIKDDNRLENLELWTRPQPAGQRVEDLIEWVVREYREEVVDLLFGGAIGVDPTEGR